MFDCLSKGKCDATVEKMVEEATGVLKGVADNSWIPWAEQVIPNVASRAREWAVAKEREAHAQKVCEEAAQEAERVAQREWQMEEKLEGFVDGKMMEEEFKQDLEAEAEVEGDEATGIEEVKESGRMETSVMEVDEDSESEVMAVEQGQQTGGQSRCHHHHLNN